jgi:cation diffusion facilitator CzcD-associated flavoprotein CzcO
MGGFDTEVAMVGAGPYGLSAASHLRAGGVDVHVLGEPLGFWRRHTPRGMKLVSTVSATDIADPCGVSTLAAWAREEDAELEAPLPAERFVEYGDWFQRRHVPDVDERRVVLVSRRPTGFRLRLSDGDVVRARRVVIATGLEAFACRPAPFDALPEALASHSSEHADFDRFAGLRVVVIGAGQSAVTSAVLLSEAGADVELLARRTQLHWAERRMYNRLGRARWLAYAPTDVGPAGLSRLVGAPRLFAGLPAETRERITERATRPCGAAWLRPRLAPVTVTTNARVAAVSTENGRLRVRLTDGEQRLADHAILATGFPVDLDRCGFLSTELRAAVARAGGSPRVGRAFESSVPGLHFVGASAAACYGPVMRFVSGTGFTSRALVRALA